MAREIFSIPSSGSGETVSLPFPDLTLPQEGEWTLEVTLSNPEAGYAHVVLLQRDLLTGAIVLIDETVPVGPSPAVHEFLVGGDRNSETVVGRCHLSELVLNVTYTPCDMSEIGSINAEITIGCLGTQAVTLDRQGANFWSGSSPLPCGGLLAGGLTLCYERHGHVAISGWQILDSQGRQCFGSNGINNSIYGTLSPFSFSTSASVMQYFGFGDCSECGCSDGDPISESYSAA